MLSFARSSSSQADVDAARGLRNTDLVEKPDRFFLAHRLLAQHAPQLGPGFWIRMTVHLNLCAGTVLGLGNDEQASPRATDQTCWQSLSRSKRS